MSIEEKWTTIGPKTTIAELVAFSMAALAEHGLDAFDFDVHGTAPDGSPILLHFECMLQRTGTG